MLRQLKSFVLPISAALIIPSLLLWLTAGWPLWGPQLRRPLLQICLGVLVGLVGLALMGASIALFVRVGRGTLAPWDPTQRLVVVGPYRYTRNPMISGVWFVLIGEALALGSLALGLWALTFVLVNTVYFVFSEEPGLERRFGDDYRVYRRAVPRWLPRLSGWIPPDRR